MGRAPEGKLVLRVALSIVFLYFGFSQLFDGISWVGLVPAWLIALVHLPPAFIVLGNGAFEVVCASLLILGVWVRAIAYLLAAHLALITLVLGFTPTGVRDFGLAAATLALALLETNKPAHD